jgi:hypothetical protein
MAEALRREQHAGILQEGGLGYHPVYGIQGVVIYRSSEGMCVMKGITFTGREWLADFDNGSGGSVWHITDFRWLGADPRLRAI